MGSQLREKNMADPLDCALDLMRRLPPSQTEDNLSGLIDLVPDLVEDLLSAVDQPLKVAHDKGAKRDYLLCDYNRDGNSYRSPWSNKYDPPLRDGALPSDGLRDIEIEGNAVFDTYRELYFEGGVSSMYAWDLDQGFAAVVLIKKTADASRKGAPMKGVWDSIHVVEVQEQGKQGVYNLASTVMLSIKTKAKDTGNMELAGSLTRQASAEYPHDANNTHVKNIGRMIEDLENKLRNHINLIYFGKTKDIVNTLRSVASLAVEKERREFSSQIHSGIGN